MNYIFKRTLILLSLALLTFSCAPKYGAHFTKVPVNEFSNPTTVIKPEVSDNDVTNWIIEEIISNEEVSAIEEFATASTKSYPVKSQQINQIKTDLNNPSIALELKEIDKSMSKKEVRKTVRENKRKVRSTLKEIVKEDKVAANDDYVLMMLLSFLIPPLGVGLTYGIDSEFWISLILTLLFWLPGTIYSMVMVHKYFRG